MEEIATANAHKVGNEGRTPNGKVNKNINVDQESTIMSLMLHCWAARLMFLLRAFLECM